MQVNSWNIGADSNLTAGCSHHITLLDSVSNNFHCYLGSNCIYGLGMLNSFD